MNETSPINAGDIATASLFLMMAAIGMGLELRDFRRVLEAPAAFLFGTLGQLVLLPATAFAIALALHLEPVHAIGLVLIAACPGGATSNAFSQYARGDVALSISLTAVSGLVSFLTVPLVVGLGVDFFAGETASLEMPFAETATRLFTSAALPVALGMAVLRWRPRIAERTRGPLLAVATVILVLMIIGLGVALSGADFLRLLGSTGPAVVALVVVMAGIALLGGRAMQLGPRQRRTITIELAIQNFNLAMVVALSIFQERTYLGPALIYLPTMLVLAAGVAAVGARARRVEGAAA